MRRVGQGHAVVIAAGHIGNAQQHPNHGNQLGRAVPTCWAFLRPDKRWDYRRTDADCPPARSKGRPARPASPGSVYSRKNQQGNEDKFRTLHRAVTAARSLFQRKAEQRSGQRDQHMPHGMSSVMKERPPVLEAALARPSHVNAEIRVWAKAEKGKKPVGKPEQRGSAAKKQQPRFHADGFLLRHLRLLRRFCFAVNGCAMGGIDLLVAFQRHLQRVGQDPAAFAQTVRGEPAVLRPSPASSSIRRRSPLRSVRTVFSKGSSASGS